MVSLRKARGSAAELHVLQLVELPIANEANRLNYTHLLSKTGSHMIM